jgi:uncharacterized membrane protein YgcG
MKISHQVSQYQLQRPNMVRKSETIRNIFPHAVDNLRSPREHQKSLAAFNLPGLMYDNGDSGAGGGGSGKGGGGGSGGGGMSCY